MKSNLWREKFLGLEITVRHQQIKSNTVWTADRNDAEDPGKAGFMKGSLSLARDHNRVILSILNVFSYKQEFEGRQSGINTNAPGLLQLQNKKPLPRCGERTDLFMGKMLVTKFLLCHLLSWNHLTSHGNILIHRH